MTTDPPPDEVFGFADDPEPAARPTPYLPAAGTADPRPAAADELDLSDEPVPRPRPDILDRPDPEPTRPWWQVPLLVLAAGGLLCLGSVAVVAFRQGFATGAVLTLTAVGALTVQVLVTSGLLAVVGGLFGIDYGPLPEAVLKLAAVNAVVSGLLAPGGLLVAGGAAWAAPCGLVLAFVAGFALFQGLFRLAVSEVLLTLAALVGMSVALVAVVGSVLLANGH
jgi:hypothetical protein